MATFHHLEPWGQAHAHAAHRQMFFFFFLVINKCETQDQHV